MASENGVEAEDAQESDNDTENGSQEIESSNPETSTTFHSKSPCEHCENSNVYGTLIMKSPKCLWHDYYKIFLNKYNVLYESQYGFRERRSTDHAILDIVNKIQSYMDKGMFLSLIHI